jgi:hypothetical protein
MHRDLRIISDYSHCVKREVNWGQLEMCEEQSIFRQVPQRLKNCHEEALG